MRRNATRYVNRVMAMLAREGVIAAPIVPPLPAYAGGKAKRGYHTLQRELLYGVIELGVPPTAANEVLDMVSTLNRLVSRLAKANDLLNKLGYRYESGAV